MPRDMPTESTNALLPDAAEWFSAAELAAMKLPGLPHTARSIQRLADELGWNAPEREGRIWRQRQGRGGGMEYHRAVLSPHQMAHLLLAVPAGPAEAGAAPTSERWAWYDRQTERTKARATERLAAIHAIYALTDAGVAKTVALQQTATARGIGRSTLEQWDALVRDIPREHWLPHLAPGHGGGRPQADMSEAAWQQLQSDYFRLSRPNFRECWYQLTLKAALNGWTLPSERTAYARLMAVPEPTRIRLREGVQALKRRLPAQKRDRAVFHAMEAVNADGHSWDVFVRWPDGSIGRPQMVTVQDVYSGKILAWRFGQTLSWHLVRATFGDVVERYGIPRLCWMDNGREFAAKRITGGQANRYRFKLKDEEPQGLLTALGVEVRWTQPYHGQAKPIERAFRDLAQRVARHPAFEGAYAGNSPVNKPANYGQRAVPFAEFVEVATQGIIQHNARPDRQSATARGRSFDETFAESYAGATVMRATAEQRRLWLLAAEGVRVRKQDGKIILHGNEYWAEFLLRHMGQSVTVRFDPDRLHEPLHIYALDGRYLGEAELFAASGFDSVEAAAKTARLNKRVLRNAADSAAAMALLPAQELAKLAPKLPEADAPAPAATRLFVVPGPRRPIVQGTSAVAVSAEPDGFEEPDELTRIMTSGGGWSPRIIEGGEDDI